MPFDGRPYLSTPLVYPADCHPDAPFVDRAVSGVLQCGYFVARNRARCLIEQCYPRDELAPSLQATVTHISIGSATYATYAGGWTWVGAQITHLVALVRYTCVAMGGTTTPNWRLVAYDGTTTVTGQSSEPAIVAESWTAFEGAGEIREVTVDVGISSLTLSQHLRMTVEGALDTTATISALKPYWIGIFAETRDD